MVGQPAALGERAHIREAFAKKGHSAVAMGG